jgi:hypothetical protein
MQHPKDVGDRSTMAIMFALRLLNYAILVPFGENTRYDLIIDNGSRLPRVQCKTGRLRDGAASFNLQHVCPSSESQGASGDYEGQIDDFAVYCPELGPVYLIPIEDVPTRALGMLCVTPARNGQRERVRLAAAYEIAKTDLY